jgi:hypothetical protein
MTNLSESSHVISTFPRRIETTISVRASLNALFSPPWPSIHRWLLPGRGSHPPEGSLRFHLNPTSHSLSIREPHHLPLFSGPSPTLQRLILLCRQLLQKHDRCKPGEYTRKFDTALPGQHTRLL